MDHLPLPSNPTIRNLDIPFLCTEEFDGGTFEDYPLRTGWHVGKVSGEVVVKRHGASVSTQEFGGFMQTWLYIGFLSATIGKDLKIETFRAQRTLNGTPLFSSAALNTIIPPWTEIIVQEEWTNPDFDPHVWKDRIYRRTLEVRDLLARIQMIPEYNLELARIGMSIATLGEWVLQALRHIFCVKDLEPPVSQVWRRPGIFDCCVGLTTKLQEHGWCRSRIAGFDARLPMSVGALWYFANMEPPMSDKNHDKCDEACCQYALVEEKNYQVLHQSGCSSCSLVGPLPEETIKILEDGELPVIAITHNDPPMTQGITVSAQPSEIGTDFVAISHVWSDGHGNPFENSLPICFLKHLSSLVNKLPRTDFGAQMSFWIDTLCVPRNSGRAKKLALLKLKDPYIAAAHVLVLDSYMSAMNSQKMSPAEILARIQASKWMQRLWTLEEGHLNKRLWIQFEDQAIDVVKITDEWRETFSRIPTLASHHVDVDIIGAWTVSQILPGPEFAGGFESLKMVREALKRRATSKAEDEPLCLASLMKMDLSKVLATTKDRRMVEFWKRVPNLDAGLAFSKATRKLYEPGYRWAPASFMGDLGVDAWDGPNGSDKPDAQLQASASPFGILVTLWSFTFSPLQGDIPEFFSSKDKLLGALNTSTTFSENKSQDNRLMAYNKHGEWYCCMLEQDWHDSAAVVDSSADVAILIAPRSTWGEKLSPNPLSKLGQEEAMLVTLPIASDGQIPIRVTAHRHISLEKVSLKENALMNHLKGCIRVFIAKEITEESQEASGLSRRDKYIVRFVRRTPEVMQLGRELLEHNHARVGRSADEKDVIGYCIWLTRGLTKYWKWSYIEQAPRQLQWCID